MDMLEGVVKAAFPLWSDMFTLCVAAFASPIAQETETPGYTLAGSQMKEEIRITGGDGGSNSTAKPFALPAAAAATLVLKLLETCDATAVKPTDVLPAGVVTLAGTANSELPLVRATGKPPDGADPLSVTTQVVDPGVVMLLEAHDNP
ncbi:MAG: hypothetical protein ACRD4O_10665, partial [Bryobacteraceae bacterium]